MTEMVDRLHPQPLSQFGRGEKNVYRENMKISIISKLTNNAQAIAQSLTCWNHQSQTSICAQAMVAGVPSGPGRFIHSQLGLEIFCR
ncbi:hypothetical protein [Hydrococcus rivularis]|uniref:hypothetical protein n=1 Tax=Hydrococcus rivularis TaxID=1616834 RepID=UPI001FE31C20|nr:hypothetical protein [Hydrococcus rivularis]